MAERTFMGAGVCAVALAWAVALPVPVAAAEKDAHEHHHHHEPAQTEYQKSVREYPLPQVNLIRQDGKKVSFPRNIDDGKPVVLNFIYTTCTAICPLLSQTFAEFQKKLGPDAAGLHMVSISIDPDQDTPQRLSEYARRYDAGPQWAHYTGTVEASVKLQQAFQAYYVDKMNHRPVVFMRSAPGKPWVRLEGFTTPDDLLKEYRALTRTG